MDKKPPEPGPENDLLRSKVFCLMPWVHLHVTQQGTVTPCCQAPWEAEHAFGNINEKPFGEIWQGEEIRKFRTNMLAGKQDERCRKCYAVEAAGGDSMRLHTNARYVHHLNWAESTSADGSAPEAKPVYWDIRYSNLCNFRCRICGPHSSSRWHDDARALGQVTGSAKVSHGIRDFEAFLREMEPYLHSVEELHFAGGEPLLMPEHARILDWLHQNKRTDVVLFYNTNLSRLSYKAISFPEIWAKFSDVRIYASLDDMGDRAELQRKDQNWEETLKNLDQIRAIAPKVWLAIGPTISVFNVGNLPKFHQELVKAGRIDPMQMQPQVLEAPEEYNIRILPPNLKKQIVRDWSRHLAYLRDCRTEYPDQRERILNTFRSILTYMEQEDWEEHRQKFREVTKDLDHLRGENTKATFPELKELWEGESWWKSWF